MSKLKILYVWGYGDSPDSEYIKQLKDGLDSKNFTVISDYYAQYSPKEAVNDLNNIIKENKIDLVIGENLGGYLITLLNKDLQKVLINPIFDPVVELPEYRITTKNDKGEEIEMPMVPEHIIKFYKENENMKRNYDNTYAIFSIDDNFTDYDKVCKSIKSDNPIQTIIETIQNC